VAGVFLKSFTVVGSQISAGRTSTTRSQQQHEITTTWGGRLAKSPSGVFFIPYVQSAAQVLKSPSSLLPFSSMGSKQSGAQRQGWSQKEDCRGALVGVLLLSFTVVVSQGREDTCGVVQILNIRRKHRRHSGLMADRNPPGCEQT